MADWAAINASFESLRLCTAKLKAHRLKLPSPGVLFRVKFYAALSVVDQSNQFPLSLSHLRDELLLLIYVNTQPSPHPKGALIDPIELVFINKDGTIVSTETRAGADVLDPYEVL